MEYDDYSDWGDFDNLTDYYEDYESDCPKYPIYEHTGEEFFVPTTYFELS